MSTHVRPRRSIGLIASVVQLALAAMLGGIAGRPDSFPNPPEPIPRGLALGLLYTLPAVIGSLGAIGGRRSLLAAAAVLSSIGSVIAFSGVTLVFLIPALVFAAAAGATSGITLPAPPSRQALALLTLAIAAVVVAVLQLGILVLPLLVLLLVGLELRRGVSHETARPRQRAGGVLLAVGVISLGIGAGWVLLSTTETRCWKAYETSAGIEYQTVPDPGSGPMTFGRDAIAGGCDGGTLTGRGAAAASVMGLAAIALGAASVRHASRRRPA